MKKKAPRGAIFDLGRLMGLPSGPREMLARAFRFAEPLRTQGVLRWPYLPAFQRFKSHQPPRIEKRPLAGPFSIWGG